MAEIESELDRAAADLNEARNAYSPLIELPGEEATWRDAQRLISRFETTKAEVLALSQQNRDTEARARMTADFDDYSKLQRRIVVLIAIERAGADGAMTRIRILQRISVIGMLAAGIVVLLVVLILGRRAIRRITSYEEQIVGIPEHSRNAIVGDAFAGRLAHGSVGLSPSPGCRPIVACPGRKAAPALGGHQPARDRLRRSIDQMTTIDLRAFARA
jgi:hypothetical protein